MTIIQKFQFSQVYFEINTYVWSTMTEYLYEFLKDAFDWTGNYRKQDYFDLSLNVRGKILFTAGGTREGCFDFV